MIGGDHISLQKKNLIYCLTVPILFIFRSDCIMILIIVIVTSIFHITPISIKDFFLRNLVCFLVAGHYNLSIEEPCHENKPFCWVMCVAFVDISIDKIIITIWYQCVAGPLSSLQRKLISQVDMSVFLIKYKTIHYFEVPRKPSNWHQNINFKILNKKIDSSF